MIRIHHLNRTSIPIIFCYLIIIFCIKLGHANHQRSSTKEHKRQKIKTSNKFKVAFKCQFRVHFVWNFSFCGENKKIKNKTHKIRCIQKEQDKCSTSALFAVPNNCYYFYRCDGSALSNMKQKWMCVAVLFQVWNVRVRIRAILGWLNNDFIIYIFLYMWVSYGYLKFHQKQMRKIYKSRDKHVFFAATTEAVRLLNDNECWCCFGFSDTFLIWWTHFLWICQTEFLTGAILLAFF